MDRNREARRVSMATSNGLSRRRHRSSGGGGGTNLRDSPEEDGGVELQETAARLRDRKKDRDRERDRERERDRDRDRLSRSKRRRAERLMHGSNREEGNGDDTSEESVNDDEDDDIDDGGGGGGGGAIVSGSGSGSGGGVVSSMRMLPPNPTSLSSSSLANHHHRKSFPPPAKVFRASPPTTTTTTIASTWKAADEMIGVSVPRKARSASTKRSHDSWVSNSGEQINRQASTSPVRPTVSPIFASPAPVPSPAPPSPPSSSNALVRKKMKPNGPKQRPPKSSSKSTSSAQDEIEIEIAEVLYGMRQPQDSSKQEIMGNDCSSIKFDSRDVNNHNKSTSDSKSRVSSPISNSQSTLLPQSSSILPLNSCSNSTPMSAIAPKRKRPRPVKYEDENPSNFAVRNSFISKVEIDQAAKAETSLPNLDKNPGSATENGSISYDLMNSHSAPPPPPPPPPSSEPQLELVKPGINLLSNSKALTEETESRDGGGVTKEEVKSPKKESSSGIRLDNDRDNLTATKSIPMVSEIECQREEKFQIDLMAPPPLRSSPERDSENGFVVVDPKPIVTDVEMELKPTVKENDKAVKIGKEDLKVNVNVNVNVVAEEKKAKSVHEETETQKAVGFRERNIDLQFDLEKSDRDSGTGSGSGNKLNHHVQKLQQQQPNAEKTAQPNSLPLSMSMASWPGGLPPMGYMAPLQGVVSMDGSTVSPAAALQQPPHLLFTQPRPKRCATHCYIARNIHYHQQFTRLNPFWPAAASSASLYGPKVGNLNVVPSPDLHGNIPVRNVNSVQDKGQGLAIYPGHSGKDKGSQAANIVDAQRKQILLQQALPPGAPSNILHGPAFIFPMSQQQQAAAAAASVRLGSVKSPPTAGGAPSSIASSSPSMSATATAAAAATAMSFNYPNMPGNETQYLAILQNNPYPFPIPAHVGAGPAYRGTHAQAMPYFQHQLNGSFYSSQMLHPSQLQQQQPPPPTQSQQSQQGHQNTSLSSGSSSSQKHLQNQQQRSHGSGINGGSGSLQGFPAHKNQSSQPLQLQQRRQQQQQQQGQHVTHQARQLESEMGGEDSPSTADSRVSRANVNIYGQSFAMPMQPPNFALMTSPVSMGGANSTSGNHTEKKPQQQGGSKAGVETLPQAFAMSFTSINGATGAPALDISSFAHNQAILQSFPEAPRHGYQQFMPAAQVAQQKKNFRVSEEGKSGGNDASNMEEERKAMAGKASSNVGQSIAFSRPDLTETSVSSIPGNTVIDSSARNLNLSSAPSRCSGSVMPATTSSVNAPNAQQQAQRNQQQQQQQQQHHMMQLGAAVRSKTPATSNGSVYTDQHPSSPMAAKFPNALSAFPQNLVQSSSSPVQSPPWKNSVRTTTSQVPSPSLASSTSSSLKNLPQQQGRTQQNHTQISFTANPKTSTAPQGQQAPNSNQSQPPPMVVGSPTTSISKGAGGSPRTTASTSSGNKGGQASALSSQQAKNSPSVPSRKSSPVGGRNVPSILGNPHVNSSSSTGNKTQLSQQQQQQQQQQQLPKQHALQQQAQQLFYPNAYMQAHPQHSGSTTSATAPSGYYMHRHRSEQQQPQQQQPVSSATSSSGMLSLSNSSTTDPARAAAAAAASNMKGGGLHSQGLINVAQFAAAQSSGKSHQLVPAGFPSYVHAVQVKQAEQKQPAGE